MANLKGGLILSLTAMVRRRQDRKMKLQISSSALSVVLETFWRKRALGKGTTCASEVANLEAGIYVVEIKDEAGRTAIEKAVKN